MKMKAILHYGKDDVRFEERDIPKIEDDELLVRVEYSGICGSDMHVIHGVFPEEDKYLPKIPGHEFSGRVAGIGARVVGYKEGDCITAHPFTGCGQCYWCKQAQEIFCLNPYTVVRAGGAWAQYTVVKAKQAYKMPGDMCLKRGALVEPASIAIYAMDFSGIRSGAAVVILGGGIIGLLCLQVAQHVGAAMTILSDPVESRLEAAKALGADLVINPEKEDLKAAVLKATIGMGVDACIEAAGSKQTIEAGISILKNNGTIVIVGITPQNMKVEVRPYEIFSKQLRITGSNWSAYSFNRTIEMMKKLNTDGLITHTFPLEDVQRALEVQRRREGIKVMFKP
jgi:2-desacetyl-2-hydroxyethyl bacteriochlorophyllide A dehydrogenase